MNITISDTSIADLVISQTENNTEQGVWNPSGISLVSRLKKDSGLKETLEQVLSAEALRLYLVEAQLAAPTRCIDGRRIQQWDELSDQQKSMLGPKVPGGISHVALAHRIVNHENTDNVRIEDDVKYGIKLYKQLRVGFGGHVDTRQNNSKTGCGAVDNISTILDKILSPAAEDTLEFLTSQVMGDSYNQEIFSRTLEDIRVVKEAESVYLSQKEDDFHYKQAIVDLLRSENDGVENVPALAGNHQEVAIVLNWVKGTTFDTDRFAADHGDDIQVFGWDIWEVFEESQRLYPQDHKKQTQYVMARTLLGMATAMVLTDGSLKLVTIQ